jgi:hypothetical protein
MGARASQADLAQLDRDSLLRGPLNPPPQSVQPNGSPVSATAFEAQGRLSVAATDPASTVTAGLAFVRRKATGSDELVLPIAPANMKDKLSAPIRKDSEPGFIEVEEPSASFAVHPDADTDC